MTGSVGVGDGETVDGGGEATGEYDQQTPAERVAAITSAYVPEPWREDVNLWLRNLGDWYDTASEVIARMLDGWSPEPPEAPVQWRRDGFDADLAIWRPFYEPVPQGQRNVLIEADRRRRRTVDAASTEGSDG